MIKKTSKNGFTLLEALLSVAVLSGVLFIVFDLIRDYSEQVLAQSTSNYMEGIGNAVENILQDPENFAQIYNDVDAQPNDIREITIADIISGNIGGVNLLATKLLNDKISNTTPLKSGINIMIRKPNTNALEVIIATDERLNDQRVRLAAEYSRLNGGFYREIVGNVKSAYNAWNFNPNALSGTIWWENIASLNPPSTNDGTYLFNYRHISFDEVSGDYLYRVNVPGQSELNRLYADLNMGGQSILGADDIDASGDVNFSTNASINGSVNVNGNVEISAGNLRANGILTTTNATINNTSGGITGNFIVQDALVVNNELNLSANLDAGTATFQSGIDSTANLGSVNISSVDTIISDTTNAVSLGGASSGNRADIIVTGGLRNGVTTTRELTVGGARQMVTEKLLTNNNLTISGTASAADLTINGLETNVFGDCDESSISDC